MNPYLAFWLGLLLAVPLSLVANLLTPNVRRLLLRWNEKRRAAFEKRVADEKERVEAILADRFKFYRCLLALIYVHLTILILFFMLYWLLSTAPDLVLFLASVSKKPADAKGMSQFGQLLRMLHPILALLFTCMFLLVLQKTLRFSRKVLGKTLHEI